MRLLEISANLGSGASPAELEEVVRGVRVAADVAYDAEVRRVRRASAERMKYPTDAELRNALERFPGDNERGPRYRAKRQLDARNFLRREGRRLLPDFWFDYFYEGSRLGKPFLALSDAGYDRLAGMGFPFPGAPGLDAMDPVLYDALVADELARAAPGRVSVRSLRYENPFWATLFGKGTSEKTVSTAVEVIEAARDFGPKRTMAKADAAVAEGTVENRIAESDLDVELKQEMLTEARLRNERLALENARFAQALSADQQRRRLIEQATRRGQLDIADALRALDVSDAQALGELGRRPLEIRAYNEQDDDSDR
jgi:hypothetical protein